VLLLRNVYTSRDIYIYIYIVSKEVTYGSLQKIIQGESLARGPKIIVCVYSRTARVSLS